MMRYIKADRVVKREIAGEIFLVPVKQKLADMQNLFVLHGVGEFIWDQLEAAISADEIVQRLADSYDVKQDDAATDAAAFLSELEAAELVRPAE